MQKITIGIEGMKCGMCESHVNDAIRKACKVKSVEASHEKNLATIIADDDFDVEAAKKSVADLGYTVTSEEVAPYEKKSFFSIFKR